MIVSKLLQFARPEEYSGAAGLISPAEVVADCLVLTRHQIEATGIEAEAHLASTGQVRISRTELQQVIVNLILNAVQAMPGGGRLTLTAEDAQDGVLLTAEDTGTGVPADMLNRIFDPFFTTKQAQGTGLGLSISHQLVSRAGGRITVQSEPGQGTRFEIFLPAPAGA